MHIERKFCSLIQKKGSNQDAPPERLTSSVVGKIRARKQSLGLLTWKVMRRNEWQNIANWQIKGLNNCAKSPLHSWTTNTSKKKKNWNRLWRTVKCLLSNGPEMPFFLARIGRPDILCSVNELARAVTKWTRACDKRLARLTSHIHHTSDHRQYCHVGDTAQRCRLGLFQDSDFAGDFEGLEINLG